MYHCIRNHHPSIQELLSISTSWFCDPLLPCYLFQAFCFLQVNFAFSARKVRGFLKISYELEGFWSHTLVICGIKLEYLYFCINNHCFMANIICKIVCFVTFPLIPPSLLLASFLHFIRFLLSIQALV